MPALRSSEPAAVSAGPAAPPAPSDRSARGLGPPTADDSGPWVPLAWRAKGRPSLGNLATVVFALLWLLTLAWGLQWRQRGQAAVGVAVEDDRTHAQAAPGARGHGAALRRALDTGDLGQVSAALCALASPPADDLDALSRRLVPGPQRDAIGQLQRARWGQDADGAAQARSSIRAAFARGPDWIEAGDADDAVLPPHYPR